MKHWFLARLYRALIALRLHDAAWALWWRYHTLDDLRRPGQTYRPLTDFTASAAARSRTGDEMNDLDRARTREGAIALLAERDALRAQLAALTPQGAVACGTCGIRVETIYESAIRRWMGEHLRANPDHARGFIWEPVT